MNYWRDLERQVDVVAHTVSHHLERAVRWYKSDTAIAVEASQSYALVELYIVDLDALGSSGSVINHIGTGRLLLQ